MNLRIKVPVLSTYYNEKVLSGVSFFLSSSKLKRAEANWDALEKPLHNTNRGIRKVALNHLYITSLHVMA